MNFLGHLYFSNNNLDLMYANLFGDFVKGKNLSYLSEEVQKGVLLHREIDTYIDHHPIILDLLHDLYKDLPKIAGIAVDLMFDHILANHWEEYHELSLEEFCQNFYEYKIKEEDYPNPQFHYMLMRMKSSNWLLSYKQKMGLEKSSLGVSRRISFENALPYTPYVFEQKREQITEVFHLFMKDAIPHFNKFHSGDTE